MATLREVYDASHNEGGGVAHDLTLSTRGLGRSEFNARCHFSPETNTRFVSYFVSRDTDWRGVWAYLLDHPSLACDQADTRIAMIMGNPSMGVPMRDTRALRFVGKIYLYVDEHMTPADRSHVLETAQAAGLNAETRDLDWLEVYNRSSKPLAFLSHDSRDKEEVARPLVAALGSQLCSVWYDEYSLKVGDSLADSISRGISEAPKCILVLFPHFFSNPGWTKAEFQAIINRQVDEGNIILPIWHRVSRQQVRNYSAFLVDIFGLNTVLGIDEVARRLVNVLDPPRPLIGQ